MSRQVIASRYGGPEVLELRERAVPPPPPGRAVVRLRAAGVNPSDAKQIAGRFGEDPARLPLRPGAEIAGVVAAVGEGVDRLRVGQEVLAHRVVGGWADEVTAKAENVFTKPPGLSFPAAANLLLAGTAAAHLLEATRVSAGDVVVVHGASGGVGSIAVQLARLAGARVLGTAGPATLAAVELLGAEPVRYGPGLTERLRALAPHGVDAALDCVGTEEAIAASVALLHDPARLATLVAFDAVLAVGGAALGAGPGADPGTAFRGAVRQRLVDLAAEGRLTVPIAGTVPLADAPEALRALARGGLGGKLALVP